MSIDYNKLDFIFEKLTRGKTYKLRDNTKLVGYFNGEIDHLYNDFRDFEVDIRKILKMINDIDHWNVLTEERKIELSPIRIEWSWEVIEKILTTKYAACMNITWVGNIIDINISKLQPDKLLIEAFRNFTLMDYDATFNGNDREELNMICLTDLLQTLTLFKKHTGKIWSYRDMKGVDNWCPEIAAEILRRQQKEYLAVNMAQFFIDNDLVFEPIDKHGNIYIHLKG